MKRYLSGNRVGAGIYLNLRHLQIASVNDTDGLPTLPRGNWVRVPKPVLLVSAPILGLVFVIFLPLIGFVSLGVLAVEMTARALSPAVRATTRVLRPAWQPALAYLGRGRRKARREEKEGKEEKEPAEDRWAEEVKQELRDSD